MTLNKTKIPKNYFFKLTKLNIELDLKSHGISEGEGAPQNPSRKKTGRNGVRIT